MTNGFGDRHATITPILYCLINHLNSNDLWWGRRDSNSHTLRRWNLNPVRLPISPRPHQGANFALDFKLAEDQGLEP